MPIAISQEPSWQIMVMVNASLLFIRVNVFFKMITHIKKQKKQAKCAILRCQ